MNNTALFDAALAAIGDCNEAWLSSHLPASYNSEAIMGVEIATQIDAAIPIIITGATISQRDLLQSIVKSVMRGRYPHNTTPNTYTDIAQSVASIFTRYSTELLNSTTGTGGGGGGTLTNLSSILYLDAGTTVAFADRNGNIEKPYRFISDVLSLIPGLDPLTLILAPGNYDEGLTQTIDRPLTISGMVNNIPPSPAGSQSIFPPVIIPKLLVNDNIAIIGCYLLTLGLQSRFHGQTFIRNCNIQSSIRIDTILEIFDCITGDSFSVYFDLEGSCKFNNVCVTRNGGSLVRMNSTGIGVVGFQNCAFQYAIDVQFIGGVGKVYLDAVSYPQWIALGCSVINGTVVQGVLI